MTLSTEATGPWYPWQDNDGDWHAMRDAAGIGPSSEEEVAARVLEMNKAESIRDAAPELLQVLRKIADTIEYIPSTGTGRPIEVFLEVGLCQELQRLLDRFPRHDWSAIQLARGEQ